MDNIDFGGGYLHGSYLPEKCLLISIVDYHLKIRWFIEIFGALVAWELPARYKKFFSLP